MNFEKLKSNYLKKNHKKTYYLISTIGILSCIGIAVELIHSYFTGLSVMSRGITFLFNLQYKTHFETKNFIINVPKFDWMSVEKNESTKVSFFSTIKTPKKEVEEKRKKKSAYLYQKNITYPLILTGLCSDYYYVNEGTTMKQCDKIEEDIYSFKADIYDCLRDEYYGIPTRYIIYDDEVFILDAYIDEFKPQYDKFFKGVWLKE